MELQRRKWPTLEVGPLEVWRKRDIVEAFLKRSLAGQCSPAGPPPSGIGGGGRGTGILPTTSTTFLTAVDFASKEGALEDPWSLNNGGGAAGGGDGRTTGGKFSMWGETGLVLFPSMVESIVCR